MLRWLFAGLLVAHGFVHITVWANATVAAEQGTSPGHSWILGDQRSVVVALTYLVTALFAVAAVAALLQVEWWQAMTLVAAGSSLVLVALFPAALMGPWIVAPVAINAVLIAAVWLEWPRSLMGA